jgi:hypothetical protein
VDLGVLSAESTTVPGWSDRCTGLNSEHRRADRSAMTFRNHVSALSLVAFGALLASCGGDTEAEATTSYSWCRSVRISVDSLEGGDQATAADSARSDSLIRLMDGVIDGAPDEVKDELDRLSAAFADGTPSADLYPQIQADLEVFNAFIEAECGVRLDVPEAPPTGV